VGIWAPGSEARRLDYQVAIKGLDHLLSVALWLDLKTGLPVKRTVTEEIAGEKKTLVETYRNLTLDQKVDASKFDLPK
jgi:outer membrane lipoprotein-sorting protein